jgi:hypothetical protein
MSVLTEADDLINGERQEAYGDPAVNLQRVAEVWKNYLSSKYNQDSDDYDITPEDVCWMMALLKMCRQMNKGSRENLIDAAGYIGLVEKVG